MGLMDTAPVRLAVQNRMTMMIAITIVLVVIIIYAAATGRVWVWVLAGGLAVPASYLWWLACTHGKIPDMESSIMPAVVDAVMASEAAPPSP